MSVRGLNHVNIRTRDVVGTVAFFRDALMMRGLLRPGADERPCSGRVLDDWGNEILHIGSVDGAYPGDDGSSTRPAEGSGVVDHIAFDCTDYDDMRHRLVAMDLVIIENAIPGARLRQLFVRDPNGIKIELNFREEGAPETPNAEDAG